MLVDATLIVERHVSEFSERRRLKIAKLSLHELLIRKNPYMFIARQIEAPQELAEEIVGAALSSSEETMFGHTLEAIAVDVCAEAFGGIKSAAQGVDLEFMRDKRRYVVSIKGELVESWTTPDGYLDWAAIVDLSVR
ncbi:MAG: PmeII family type II restriction endonuclease [bacterium]|nr:PmeII family type II restriction endonuclease [bacterium]